MLGTDRQELQKLITSMEKLMCKRPTIPSKIQNTILEIVNAKTQNMQKARLEPATNHVVR